MSWSQRPGLSLSKAAAAVAIVSVAACASRAATPVTTPPAPSQQTTDRKADLVRDLSTLFGDARFEHALWAVDVRSLITGETLYSHNAASLMIPASNQKLLSTAVAAERLGWDYRFTTRLLATGPLRADGTLDGDLVIVGDGDPTINPRHPERWRVFDEWAQTLADRGIRVIGGHLVGDDDAVAEPGWGDGWSWDDLYFGYGAQYTALQYNENQIEVSIGPGMAAGAPAVVYTAPLGSGLLVDNGVVTAGAGVETNIQWWRVPGTIFLVLKGQVAIDAAPQTLLAAVENPTRLYLAAFREALGRHGIFVAGSALDVDDLRTPPKMTSATELIVDRSPPLADIVDVTLKWSRNGYAETLLTALSSTRPATAAEGLAALKSTLHAWGLDDGDYVPRDGSGLSRYDYLTARLLTALLTHMWTDPKHRQLFRSSLPVPGESGTLADRMKETPAAGRVWAKTGTLSNVRSLSGYLLTRDDEPLVFSILVNHFRTPAAEADEVADRAVVRLVEFSRQ